MKLLLAMLIALVPMLARAQVVPAYGVGVASANAAYTGTAGNTSTFPAGQSMVMVFCTTTCFVKVGEGAVATTSDIPLPANVVVVLKVPVGTGSAWRVSAIQQSTGGSVFAQPVN